MGSNRPLSHPAYDAISLVLHVVPRYQRRVQSFSYIKAGREPYALARIHICYTSSDRLTALTYWVSLALQYFMATPSQIQYQFQHIHDDRTKDIIISHAIVLPLAVLAVLLRFISRRLCKTQILADDIMIVVALVISPSLTSRSPFREYGCPADWSWAAVGPCYWRRIPWFSLYV